MARYKETGKDQGYFIPVVLSDQIVEGTYEDTLRWLIDEKLDLGVFDRKYGNDETGATAINPKILLKIILYCYYMGVLSSRKIAAMCKTHMTAKALAEDTEPHYTTISNFVSEMGGEIDKVFTEVLLVCDELKLIGGKMYALDGCKQPSNASKEMSGTMEELGEKYDKIKKISRGIIEKHKRHARISKTEREKKET
jgi:transposase